MIDRVILVVLLGLLGLTCATQCPKQRTSPGREVVCYTSVFDVEKLTDSICKCTTLVHQGYDVRNLTTSAFQSFQKSLKEISPPTQFVISVEDPGKTIRTSGTVRQETAARLIGILKEVDGIELNMTAGSKERLTHFVKSLKDEMVRKSYDKRLFMVLPTKSEELAKQFDLKDLSKYVDLFTMATHYLVEEDESYHTFHPSRLMGLFDIINTDSLIDLISGLGAPKSKILVSVPASAYKFTLKDQDDNAPRSATVDKDPVIIDRKQLCDSMNKGEWTIERDEDLTAPYAFKNKTWIAFEDDISVGIKGKYALLRELPGLAIRNIENDLETRCGKPVTHEIYRSFTDFKRKSRGAVLSALEDELHQSEISYPNQIKSSDFRVVRVVDTEGHIRVVRENTQTEFTCKRQGYFVHPKSCNRFYRCVKFNQEVEDYSVFEFDCPAGLAFDENTEVCVWPGSLSQGSPCPGSSEIAPVTRIRFRCPSQQGYYADPQNGRWFFACIDLGGPELMAYEFRCPYGLVFDEHKLVCEWPWLVEGYTGNAYARTEYDNTGYTQGVGGYATDSLPHGFSGATGGLGYSGSGYSGTGVETGGVHSGGSGFSGPAGVEYAGHSTGSHGSSFGGSGGAGYSGSTIEGHGTVTASGYSGSGNKIHGGSGSYTGSAGSSYTGSAGHFGSTDSGYSDKTGYSGTSGNLFSNGIGVSHGGAGYGELGGSSDSGVTGGVHGGTQGSTYTGSSGGYSQTFGSHGINTGSTFEGYQGSTVGTDDSFSGTKYAGATGGHSGSSVSGGYLGTTGKIGFSSGSHTGSSGGGYSGSNIGLGYSVGGSDYTGSIEHSTTSGLGYGSTAGTSSGSQGGYSVGGSDYSGSAGQSTISGSKYGSTAGLGSGLQGGYSVGGSDYSGSAGHSTISGSKYSSTAGLGSGLQGGYSVGGSDYSGSGGHSTISESGYGSTVGAGSASQGGYSVGGSDYSGSAGQSTISGSKYGSTAGLGSGLQGGYSVGGSDYSGSAGHSTISGSKYGSTAGPGSGLQGGYSVGGSDYSGSAGHSTISGSKYGSTAGPGSGLQGGYSVGGSDYSGSAGQSTISGSGYGSTVGTGGVSQGGYSIDLGHSGFATHSTSSGSAHAGSSGQDQSEYTNTKYSGSTGTGSSQGGYSVPGHSVTFGTSQSKVPIYSSTGATGSGYIGSTLSADRGQGSGTISVGQEYGTPSVSYIPGTSTVAGHSGVFSTSGNGQKYATSGHITDHGISTGSAFSGQPGIATTHFGNAATSGYVTNDIGLSPGKGVITSGTAVYHDLGGVTGSFHGPGDRSNLNITLIGSGIPSVGSATYHGGTSPGLGYSITGGNVGTGAIVTGNSVQGSIATDDSSSGTLLTHGDTAGTVFTGSSDQGSIITGSGQPGYTKTGTGTPGYVISEGVKTIYTGSGSPGTIIHGTAAPGVLLTGQSVPGTIIKGESSPGIVLTGQTSPGVSLGGSVEQGTIIGSTGSQYFTDSGYTTYHGSGAAKAGTIKPGSPSVTYDTGYKANEYYNNGDRGTVKFNNGYETNKYTDNDIPDYRPVGGITADTIIPGGSVITGGHGSFGTTSSGIQTQTPSYPTQPESLRPSGFTKTGLTRTGITTATLGGRGSYVISTGKPRPPVGTDQIGEKAFDGNVAGYTKTSTESSVKSYSEVTPTQYEDGSRIDTSKITLGSTQTTGYSYPKPSVQFETGVPSSTESGGFTATTPSSFLNVHVYNTPKVVDSAPITASPAVVNTYTSSKSSDDQYRGSSFSRIPTGFTRRPSSTSSPILYTTGPLENYKTTIFEAAKLPVTISTVQPVIDTGYKTVISPSSIPVTLSQDKYNGNVQTQSVSTYSQFDVGLDTSAHDGFGNKEYVSVTTSSTIPTKSRPFGSTISVPTVTYGPPTVTVRPQTNYVSSTVSPGSGYSYVTSKAPFGQKVTPSGVSESLKPQTQYLPTDSISPAVGVTYRKPFPLPGITYQSTPQPVVSPVTSKTYSFSSDSSNFGQGFTTNSQTLIGSSIGGSPANIGISKDEVGKLITNYNRGTTKYVPNQYDLYTGSQFSGTTGSFDGSSRKQTFSTIGQTYGTPTQKPFSVTTYSGGYSKPSYEVTTKSPEGKGKVIVKWSDLHPLLLGKLGAECTCKADPFGNLRGPARKLIASSNGQVDLSNYDESEIYVDLEKDGSYEDGEYNYETSSPGPVKVWDPNLATASLPEDDKSQTHQKPLSTYLPIASSTVAPAGILAFNSNSPKEQVNFGGSSLSNRGYTSGHRSGKNLNDVGPSTNSVNGEGASFDRYGPGGLRGSEEILEGATDCARPGLFRHPNFCNKFYACHWDEWKKKFTLHVFNCPVHLTFDTSASACNWPSKGPACQDDNLLV